MEFSFPVRHLRFRGAPLRRETVEWLALGAMGLLGCLLGVFGVWTERRLIVRHEYERLQVQARIVDENLRRQLDSVRSALESLRRIGAERGDALNAKPIQTLKNAMPGVRAIVLLDAQGRIVQSSDDLRDAHLDDREFLRSIDGMRDPQVLHVARPYENTPGNWNIKLSMTTVPTPGRAQGVITAIVDTAYFDVVTQSVVYAPDMASSIAQQDGFVMLSVPPRSADEAQQPEPAADPARLQVERTITAAELHLEKPLVVTVSRSYAELNKPWVRLALEYGVVWALFGAMAGLGLYAMQKKRAAIAALNARRDAERNEHAQRIELTLAGANLGLWELLLPQRRLRIDLRAAAVVGDPAGSSEMAVATWQGLIHPDDRPAVEHALAMHLSGELAAFESEHRLRHRDGRWIWVLCKGRIVEHDAAGRPVRLLGTRMDISDRKKHEEEIERLAFYDGLTGLPNRRLLMDRLGRATAANERLGQCGAVLFIDLDNFKDLNDTLGHDKGDQLLARVAARLLEVTRKSDTVARLGGDEFVVLLEGLGASRAEATRRAEHVGRTIVERLSRPYRLDAHQIHSTPSIGVTLFGDGAGSVDELLQQADLAMYQAKSAGRNTLRLFDPQMQILVAAGAELEADLRGAQQRGELLLHYQPIVDAEGCITGVEALLRWSHPQRGMVSPAQFIPVAEKSGLILPIGGWVLETACRQLKLWAANAATRHLTASVNVSARQLRQDDFVHQVVQTLQRHGVPASRLRLELTESMLLNDVEDVIGKMNALKSIGVGFSLDDFGTGYSSLSYLKRLPLDQLKIDQSFVREVPTSNSDASIARVIVGLARSLGLGVVAEGVETEAQRRFLLDNGCDGFQGYLFARPGPAAQVALLLQSAAADCQPLAHAH